MHDRTAPIMSTSASTARGIISQRPTVVLRSRKLLKLRERKDVPGRRERVNVEILQLINRRSRMVQKMGDHQLQRPKRKLRMMSKTKRSQRSKLFRHKRPKDNLLTQGPKKPP